MDQEDNCATSCCINGFTKPTTIYSFKGLAWLRDKDDEESGERWVKTHKDYLVEQMLDAEFAEEFLREQRLLAEKD